MTPTETGLYGPGDFGPEFWPIDWLVQECGDRRADPVERMKAHREWQKRAFARDQILDLAEDLDARGLFLTRINVVERDPIIIEDDE